MTGVEGIQFLLVHFQVDPEPYFYATEGRIFLSVTFQKPCPARDPPLSPTPRFGRDVTPFWTRDSG